MGIRLGILGTGSFAQCFIPLFRDHPLVDQLVLCDQDAATLAASAAKHGVARTVPTFDALLASDVDAVAIFTQHWMHAPQAVRVMEAGKDAYSAVPAAASIEEMTSLVRAVERTGRIYQMGETSHYRTEAIYCRERFRAGDFGRIVYAGGEYLHDWDHGLYEVARRRYGADWRKQAGRWAPMQYPTHSVGHVLAVTGAHALKVSCVGVVDTKPEDADMYSGRDGENRFSNQTAVFSMSDGSAMRINEMRRVGHRGCERMSLYGTEGCFERTTDASLWSTKQSVERLDASFAKDHPDTIRRQARLPAALRSDGGHGGSHAFLADDFVKACAWRLQPPVNVWVAARYLLPGLAAVESATRGGEQLDVPDLGEAPQVDLAAFERCTDPAAAAAAR